MAEGLFVRPATVDDTETIAGFNAAMAYETEQLELDRDRLRLGVAAVLHDPGKGFYLVAELNGRVVGQMMITYEWSDWRNGNFWWIQSVYVASEQRKSGVFRSLYEYAAERARTSGNVCGLRLYVERHNERAQRTYRRLGMYETEYQMYEIDYVLPRKEETSA